MKKKNGFTLIELMILIAIVGITIALIIPFLHSKTRQQQEKSKVVQQTQNESSQNGSPSSDAPAILISGMARYIDKEAGVVCYTFNNNTAPSCLPINQTKLPLQ